MDEAPEFYEVASVAQATLQEGGPMERFDLSEGPVYGPRV